MKRFYFLILIFVHLNVTGQNLYTCDSGSVQFSSDAALELIKASSHKLTGVLDVEKKTFAFLVNINSFEGFNAALQREHFNENYMESAKYKTAAFTGKIIEDVDFNKDGKYPVRAKGALSIHGVTQERIIKCVLTINGGTILAESEFRVLLNEHNIKVPKVVHEKIAAAIEVVIKTELKKKN